MPKTHHAPATISASILLLSVVSFSLFLATAQNTTTPTWTGGPEDTFFCGYKWDDPDCLTRQHCPSGRNEECELFADGQKCFANSPCDTRYGDGSGFVAGVASASSNSTVSPMATPATPVTPRPTYTGVSDDPTDHRWCGVGLDEAKTCVQHCPSGETSECPQGMICFPDITECDARNIPPDTLRPTEKATPAPSISPPPVGPTRIPTDMPIPPPDPLPYPSDDPTDHWFCGVGIDDANSKCSLHCPSANECPIGQICYFGTMCDGRTFAPTPPPTHRPTKAPTNYPTLHPTESMPPSFGPSTSALPTAAPSQPMPTKSPTKSPTGRPTWAPLPALQLTFFCGSSWNDAVDNCKKRCPTGEDTECPNGDFCFTGTPCTEEQGYPDTDDSTDDASSSGGQECVPFQVTITADAWPNEISWVVNNTETQELVAHGGNDDLVSGEPFDYPVECINNRKGCYAFTILDSGGDGLCCSEGQGSYTISYDGVELTTGDAFYDYETTEFGLCGATEAPTKEPILSSVDSASVDKPNGAAATSSSGVGFRCVDRSLADRGYQISEDKCSLFDDCFNPQIKLGDDWFCDESSTCIEAAACGDAVKTSIENAADESETDYAAPAPVTSDVSSTVASSDTTPAPKIESDTTTNTPEIASISPSVASATIIKTPAPTTLSNSFITSAPIAVSDMKSNSPQVSTRPEKVTSTGKEPFVQKPGVVSTGNKAENATQIPTVIPTTSSPTLGPCDGEPCKEEGHCRSQYGFCGPGETYCNEKATWTQDCPDLVSTSSPIAPSEPPSISSTNVGIIMSSMSPSTKKSSGWTKPGGGKGSVSRPVRTHPPTEPFPYFVYPALTQPIIPSPAPISIDSAPPSPYPMAQAITPPPTFENIADSGNPTFSSGYSTVSPSVSFVASSPPSLSIDHSTTSPTGSLIMTAPPTKNATDWTSAPSTAVETLPPTESATVKATNEFTCTGERCPVDSHCRSRYGSCGPGFIYCNDYSIWDSTCPPPVPGVTPTRSPTAKPTSNDTEINTTPSLLAQPSFPPIAKPTLPTITEAHPFVPGDNIGEGFLETDEVESKDAKDEDVKSNANPSPSPKPIANKFQTSEYLDLWADTARSRGSINLPLPEVFVAVTAIMYLLIDLS